MRWGGEIDTCENHNRNKRLQSRQAFMSLNTYYFPLTEHCVVASDPMMATYYYSKYHGDESYRISMIEPTEENPSIIAKITYISNGKLIDSFIHLAVAMEELSGEETDPEGTIYEALSLASDEQERWFNSDEISTSYDV